MNEELNIIEAVNMPVGTEFEMFSKSGIKETQKVIVSEVLGSRKLIWEDGKDVKAYGYTMNAKFIPVQKPVSFMEAVKSGKTIRCDYKEFNGEETTNIYKYGGIDKPIEDTCNFGISTREILNGKWYIEE